MNLIDKQIQTECMVPQPLFCSNFKNLFLVVEITGTAGWGIGGSVIAAECRLRGPKSVHLGIWAAATCAAPPSVIAGQYATSNC